MLAYAVAALTGHPLAAFRTVRRIVETALHITERNRLPEVQAPPSPFSAPRTRLNQAITPHRRVAFCDIGLDEVKSVKNHVGTTVNDVVLELCAGLLRRYLLSHDELPEDPLVAMVPISVRTEAEKGTGGNRVSAMLVSLATDVADPIARLKTIGEGTRHAKDQEKAIGADTLTDWTEFTFPALMGLAARLTTSTKVFDRVRPLFNVTISNVPGPQFPLYQAGAELCAMHPVGPIHEGIGLNITVMSYLGRMFFGFQACRETVPDLAVFPDLLQESLQELLDAIGHTGPRKGKG
jgi:WS/DGAT/MGAT family acyltransferase